MAQQYGVVETAFDYLCTTHGELVAVIGGTWGEIAAYKPASMSHEKALAKKKDAICIARTSLKLEEERAAAHKARLQTEEVAREAKEAADKVSLAAERLLKEAKHTSDRTQEVAARIARENAAAAQEQIEADLAWENMIAE